MKYINTLPTMCNDCITTYTLVTMDTAVWTTHFCFSCQFQATQAAQAAQAKQEEQAYYAEQAKQAEQEEQAYLVKMDAIFLEEWTNDSADEHSLAHCGFGL
jgi:hypothetical protein